MFSIIKQYWLEILVIVGFIVFSFIFPVRIISLITGGLIAVCGMYIVTHDEKRIKDPYASILGFLLLVAFGLFVKFYW